MIAILNVLFSILNHPLRPRARSDVNVENSTSCLRVAYGLVKPIRRPLVLFLLDDTYRCLTFCRELVLDIPWQV